MRSIWFSRRQEGGGGGQLSAFALLDARRRSYVVLGETALVVGDRNTVRLAGCLVRRRDVQDAVGVDIERDLDLGNTTRRGRNAGQLELAEQVVVLRQRSLSLEHLDQDRRLVVRGSRKAEIMDISINPVPLTSTPLTSDSCAWG